MKSIKKVIIVGVFFLLAFSFLASMTGTTEITPYKTVYAEMHAEHAVIGGPSYFTTTIRNITGQPRDKDISPLAGTELVFEGWCVDTSQDMDDTIWYKVQAFSSYNNYPEAFINYPDGIVDYPENLDLINYIINQDYVGRMSRCGTVFTYGDVQRAMWLLIDDRPSLTPKLGPWEQCRVRQILHEAWNNGDGYMPGWGDEIAILLDCIDPDDGQTSIIEVPIPYVYYRPCDHENERPQVENLDWLFEHLAKSILFQ